MSRSPSWSHARRLWLPIALAAVAAAAALPAAAAASPSPVVVCNQYGGQAGPDVAGTMAVWTDNRNGNLDIYGRVLGTSKTYAVCTDKAQQDNPSVTRYVTPSGAIHYVVVWVDGRNHAGGEATDIYARDITARRSFAVARGATIKWYPDIAGNWVVWLEADDPAGPYRVMARDIEAGTTWRVATSKVLSPVAVDWRTVGSRRVYTAVYASARGDIAGRNLPDGTPFVVSAKDTFEWMPDISRNRVVWWESGGRIVMRDLRTHKRTFVHSGSRPRISGELVTWDGGGRGGRFVISYVAGARISVRNAVRGGSVVSFGVGKQTNLFPAISGRRVVWESGPARRVLTHIHIYGTRLR